MARQGRTHMGASMKTGLRGVSRFANRTLAIVISLSMLAFPKPIQAATIASLSAGSVSASAGSTVTLPINFVTGPTAVASLQFTLTVPAGWTITGAAAGAAGAGAGKSGSIYGCHRKTRGFWN